MLTLKEFAVPFGIVFFPLWLWLFRGKPARLFSFFLLTGFMMFLFYRNEDVGKVVFERQRILVEMKTIREEVFAKVEEVKKLAEKMGELTAFNIVNLWRFPPEDPVTEIVQQRDRLIATLKEMGIDDSRIKEITSKIDNTVTLDLARHVWDGVPKELLSEWRTKGLDPSVISKTLTDTLMNSRPGQAQQSARVYLEPLGGWAKGVQDEISRFEEFRRNGTLPKREMKKQGMRLGN